MKLARALIGAAAGYCGIDLYECGWNAAMDAAAKKIKGMKR